MNELANFNSKSKEQKKVVSDLSSRINENKIYIDRLESLLKDNGIVLPDRERFSQILYADDAASKMKLKDGSREEVESLLKKMKELFRPLYVEVQFKNLTFWKMASEPSIDTVGSTFKDLFNFVPKPKRRVDMLKDLTGRFAPFKMTLLLGPPGSGRTVFMQALCGRLRPVGANLEGEILYNGDNIKSNKFLVSKVADYIEQNDTHAATLTVEETVKYAWVCTTGGNHSYGVANDHMAALELNGEDERYTRVANILTSLGLTGCKDTVVGNDMIRGVSGGQKRRVTSAEMLVIPRSVKFMDAISNGLDSATTFDICRSFREYCHILGTTFCVSLLQPSPEVYNLFDEVILLSEGQIIYHGPREETLPYFESLGYVCPPHVDEADFLQELPTNEGKRYIVKKEGRVTPKGSEQLAQAFKSSYIYQRMIKEMEQGANPEASSSDVEEGRPLRSTKEPMVWPAELLEKYTKNLWFHFQTTFYRQAMLTMRDTAFLKTRVIQNLIIGTIGGSLFSNIEITDVFTMNGFIFYCLIHSALGGFSLMPICYSQKAVYYKHADANFYPTTAFTISQSIVLYPLQLVENLVFSIIVYWAAGLAGDFNGSRFLCFCLLMFTTNVTLSQFFRLISFVFPDIDSATPVAALMVFAMVLFSGFIQPQNIIEDEWIWFYWMNPVAWSIMAVTINEYKAPKYDFPACDGCTERYGDMILKQYGNPTDQKYIWYAFALLLAEYFLALILSTLFLKYVRIEHAPAVALLQEEDGHNTSDDIQENSEAVTGVELPFEPVSFSFKEIWYTVTLPSGDDIDLLKGVDGYFEPGYVTALMGSSGAGKTTLLDVLSGRKNQGVIKGNMYINGVPKNDAHFRRIMGYVEQFDSLSLKATAKENIEFSAALRLASNITAEQRSQWVETVVDMLELTPIKDAIVGTAETGGMSFEQRKRVSIGVELASNPSILFLDEPTTGLDSRAAQVVIRNIRKVAASGRSVVCTIHQPSTPIFFSFDALLLLQRGGQTVYFGDLGKDGETLIRYLEQVPGVVPISQHQNPAVWMLEAIGAGTASIANDTDFHAYYKTSGLCEANTIHLNSLIKNENDPEYQNLHTSMKNTELQSTGFNASYWEQCRWLGYRFFTTYWRSPAYNVGRVVVAILIALLFGSAYPDFKYHDALGVISLTAVIFSTALFIGLTQMLIVLPMIFNERPAFYREQQSNMYSIVIYTFFASIVELPYLIVTSLAFTIPFYYIVGLENHGGISPHKFVWYWLYNLLFMTLMTYLGQFFAALMPTDPAAHVMTSFTNTTLALFCGFLITEKNMLPFWRFMYWLNPLHYTLEGLFFTQFHHDNTLVSVTTDEKLLSGEFLKDYFRSWNYGHIGYDILALVLLILMSRLGLYVCFAFINHQKR